jgi:hypothetical protein
MASLFSPLSLLLPFLLLTFPHSPLSKVASWGKFNTELADGLTGYERELIERMRSCKLRLADTHCFLDLHVCHFGDAHPIFLQGVQNAVEGHFHTLTDVDNLEKEMEAESNDTNTKVINSLRLLSDSVILQNHMLTCLPQIVLVGPKSGQNIELPAALNDGVLCSRGTIPIKFLLEDIAQAGQVQIKIGGKNQRGRVHSLSLSLFAIFSLSTSHP